MAEPAPTARGPHPPTPNETRQDEGGEIPAHGHGAPRSSYQSEDPPAYHTVLPPQSEPETTRLLPTQNLRRRNGPPAIEPAPERKKQFSLTKFILLWLGIGRFYALLCIILHFVFLGGGIAVICLIALKGAGFTTCPEIRTAEILTIVAGGMFISLAAALPCVWYCHYRIRNSAWQESRRDYDYLPFNACYCLLSLAYVSITVALATQIYDHRNVLWFWKNTTGLPDPCPDTEEFDYIPLFTLLPMSGLLVIFLMISFVMFVAGWAKKEAI